MTEPAKPLKVRPKKLTPADEMAMVFARSATRAGCPPDQIFNFCKAGVWLQPKQLEFCAAARQCDLPDGPKAILNGGGRGPLALWIPILTLDGWKTMGTIQVGDVVFDENGNPCNVISKSEIFYSRECFCLEFDSGEKIVCDADHEWMTATKAQQKAIDRRNDDFRAKRRIERGGKPSPAYVGKNLLPTPIDGSIKSTREIFNTLKAQNGREVNHRIRVAKPLMLSEKQFPLHPYLLGLWLGDGDSARGYFTTADDLHLAFAAHGFRTKYMGRYRYAINEICPALKSMNLLNNKHIPEIYFYGSQQQRIELVRGLMDTDGTCSGGGQASFCNTNPEIAFGFARLIHSLGVKCSVSKGEAKLYGRVISDCYKINFTSHFNPFELFRKASRYKISSRKTTLNHYIVSATKVDSVPVQCIGVDSPSHLFLCGESLIPTHNTGKSHTVLAQIFCDDCQRVPGLKCLFIRKVGQANKEQINDFVRKLLVNLPHKYREATPSKVEFPNGSFVLLGNFKDEKDIDKYLGLEYDLIYIMESNQLTQTKKVNVLSCLRTNKPDWRVRCYQDTNPGGIDHCANKMIFVDPWKRELAGGPRQTETRYIHSTVDDNKFVDADYKKFLEKLVGWQREAWLNGSWEFMAGAFFSNFHRDTHVYPNAQTDLNSRAILRWFAGMDYGFSHPNAFVLCCETEGGDVFIVATYSQTGTLIEEHAANVGDLLRLYNLEFGDLEFIAAGRDCFRVDKDGSTVATEYQARGVTLTPVQIDRVNAWSQMAEVFGDPMRQIRPRCFIHKNCEELILQIQAAQSDPKRPNDILKMNADENGEGGDDQLEAARNALVMAYSSLLKSAMPIRLGNYQPMIGNGSETPAYIPVESVIADAEANEAHRRDEMGW